MPSLDDAETAFGNRRIPSIEAMQRIPVEVKDNIYSPVREAGGNTSQALDFNRQVRNFAWAALNTLCTITIVFLNKRIFSDDQLHHCQISVAIWHFFATAVVLFISTRSPINTFEAVRIPLRNILPISIFFAGFLILGNLSLTLNSVGFYQIMKSLTSPCVVLWNFLLFRQTVSRMTLICVAIVTWGVMITTLGEMHTNTIGTLVAIAAFSVTALYQIWIGKQITDLEVSAPQLLLNQGVVSVFVLACLAPFVDKFPNLALVPHSALWALFFSGICAAFLNLSQFMIIGGTSVLTFNIISNVKTIGIILLGWYSTSYVPSVREVLGCAIAICGASAYAQYSVKK